MISGLEYYTGHKPIYNQMLSGITKFGRDLLGYSQWQNSRKSYQAQIDYEEYLRNANQRALDNWNRTYGRKGLTIKYPEFSYPGQIARSNTAIARNMLDYSSADSNMYGNVFYRTAGLYGISGSLFRHL